MISTDEFLRLKHRVTKLEQEYHQAQGSRDTLLKRLQDQLECESMEEAVIKLQALEQHIEKCSRRYGKKLHEFKERWEAKMESASDE